MDNLCCRKMIGEHVPYYRGEVFADIYDGRFLIKPAEAAKRLLVAR